MPQAPWSASAVEARAVAALLPYEQRPDAATGETVHRAVDWEPFEISIVPVPIDRDASVRGEAPQGAPAFAIEPALPDEDIPMPESKRRFRALVAAS